MAISLVLVLLLAAAPPTQRAVDPLPPATSRYNQGNAPGRYRDADGKVRRFELRQSSATLYDGSGRAIGETKAPTMLNVGAFKSMTLQGAQAAQWFAWAWKTDAGLSGWIAREALIDPPDVKIDENRNPKPPKEAQGALVINAAAGLKKLHGLRHVNSLGIIPSGGNRGEHYSSRNPGGVDYVYLLFAVPNVQRGGVAKDSIPDGGRFIQGLDEEGNPIIEIMKFYRDGDLDQPVEVTFLYGRAETGDAYGWLARANVGDL